MAFSETYREQVILSRQERSRRALFWSRIVGVLLMLLVAVVLRTEPQLRADLVRAALDGALTFSGRVEAVSPGSSENENGIRINRPGPQIHSTDDLLERARDVGKRLSARPVGPTAEAD